jgi:hypothetical protein
MILDDDQYLNLKDLGTHTSFALGIAVGNLSTLKSVLHDMDTEQSHALAQGIEGSLEQIFKLVGPLYYKDTPRPAAPPAPPPAAPKEPF